MPGLSIGLFVRSLWVRVRVRVRVEELLLLLYRTPPRSSRPPVAALGCSSPSDSTGSGAVPNCNCNCLFIPKRRERPADPPITAPLVLLIRRDSDRPLPRLRPAHFLRSQAPEQH